MKEIKAFLQPHVLTRVIRSLHELPHFPGLTIFEAAGQGRGRGAGGTFVLNDENLFFHKRKVLAIVASPSLTPRIVEIIRQAAHTGLRGDGIIVVTDVASVTRIRTGERSSEAP